MILMTKIKGKEGMELGEEVKAFVDVGFSETQSKLLVALYHGKRTTLEIREYVGLSLWAIINNAKHLNDIGVLQINKKKRDGEDGRGRPAMLCEPKMSKPELRRFMMDSAKEVLQ